jgi:hypothetical protein
MKKTKDVLETRTKHEANRRKARKGKFKKNMRNIEENRKKEEKNRTGTWRSM